MRRQEILARDDPAALWVILDQWVLRRPVGGRHVMLEQVNRLIEAARLPHIVIEVIPAGVGAHEGVTGAFAGGFRGRAERGLPGRPVAGAAGQGTQGCRIAGLDLGYPQT